MSSKAKNILVILPTPRDKDGLKDIDTEKYNLHWMHDETFTYPNIRKDYDLVSYTEKCSDYISKNNIDGVVYSHDLANMVAGVLCDRHNILGPSFESMFLTNHKYYSRRKEPKPIWSDYIDLKTGEWGELTPTYPCYIKPACLFLTLFQYKIDNEEQMEKALETLREELPAWLEPYNKFFERYVDTEKYPHATKELVVVEQLVDKSHQHCIEGWFDPDGTLHIWKISDYVYYPNERESIDVYVTPSTESKDKQEKLINYAVETVKNHGIKYGFWNVEMWSKDDGWLTVTEVNGRSASVWHDLYKNTFDKSLYNAMLYLACGEAEKVYKESPDSDATVSDRVGCQFHVITYGEGKASDLLDFEYIRSIDETDVEVFPDENDFIKQNRTTGAWLARFHLFGNDYSELCKRADDLRERMLKKPELSPQPAER